MREVSKVFQEVIRSDLQGLLARVNEGVKGELVLVVEGKTEETGDTWKNEAENMLQDGMSVKDIASLVSNTYNLPKNEVKKFLLSR